MSFFDTTPLGRIVNRFSKDVDVVDVNIPQYTQNLMTTFAPLIATLIMIIYSIPIFGVAIIPLAIIYVVLQVRIVHYNIVQLKWYNLLHHIV